LVSVLRLQPAVFRLLTGESWSIRWYTPLLALAGLLLALLILALAFMEVLTARSPSRVPPSAWLQPLQQVEAATARGDDTAAVTAWRHAYGAAIRSSQWEGLMEVGAAAHRLADGHENARQAYRTALFRAQREGSLDGLLRAAIAFGDLGDRDVLIRALRLAERAAGNDPAKRARVRNVSDQLIGPRLEAEHHDPTRSGGEQP
jgi:hypothetical protein